MNIKEISKNIMGAIKLGASFEDAYALEWENQHEKDIGKVSKTKCNLWAGESAAPVKHKATDDIKLKIFDLLSKNQPMSQRAISGKLGINEYKVRYHVRQMEDAGQLKREPAVINKIWVSLYSAVKHSEAPTPKKARFSAKDAIRCEIQKMDKRSRFTSSDMAKRTSVGRECASAMLRSLMDDGFLTRRRQTRGFVYEVAK